MINGFFGFYFYFRGEFRPTSFGVDQKKTTFFWRSHLISVKNFNFSEGFGVKVGTLMCCRLPILLSDPSEQCQTPLPTFQKVDPKQGLVTCNAKQSFFGQPPHRIQSVTPVVCFLAAGFRRREGKSFSSGAAALLSLK